MTLLGPQTCLKRVKHAGYEVGTPFLRGTANQTSGMMEKHTCIFQIYSPLNAKQQGQTQLNWTIAKKRIWSPTDPPTHD